MKSRSEGFDPREHFNRSEMQSSQLKAEKSKRIPSSLAATMTSFLLIPMAMPVYSIPDPSEEFAIVTTTNPI